MSIKIRIPLRKSRATGGKRGRYDGVMVVAAAVFIVLVVAVLGVFSYYWVKYARIVDRRMQGPIFTNSARVYAAPASAPVIRAPGTSPPGACPCAFADGPLPSFTPVL